MRDRRVQGVTVSRLACRPLYKLNRETSYSRLRRRGDAFDFFPRINKLWKTFDASTLNEWEIFNDVLQHKMSKSISAFSSSLSENMYNEMC